MLVVKVQKFLLSKKELKGLDIGRKYFNRYSAVNVKVIHIIFAATSLRGLARSNPKKTQHWIASLCGYSNDDYI